MRKLIYTIATAIIFSLAFTSCEEKNNNGNGNGYGNGYENGIRKLPIRIVMTATDFPDWIYTWIFRYDEQNRLTEFIVEWESEWGTSSEIYKIEYDANNRVSKIIYFWSNNESTLVRTFQYVDNQMYITNTNYWGDTLFIGRMTLNTNGQVTKWEFKIEQQKWIIGRTLTYTNGNLTQDKITGESEWITDFTYSSALNVFRNVASPDWLFLFDELLFLFFPPSQYMPSKVTTTPANELGDIFITYQTDLNGWVTSSTITITGTDSFEDYSSRTNTSRFFEESSRFGTRAQVSTRDNAETITVNMTFEYILAK